MIQEGQDVGIQSSIMGMHALFGNPICPIVIKGRLWMCWLMVRFNDNRRITHDHGHVRTHLSAVELCKQSGSDCAETGTSTMEVMRKDTVWC